MKLKNMQAGQKAECWKEISDVPDFLQMGATKLFYVYHIINPTSISTCIN